MLKYTGTCCNMLAHAVCNYLQLIVSFPQTQDKAWKDYLRGHIVSVHAAKIIGNFVASTCCYSSEASDCQEPEVNSKNLEKIVRLSIPHHLLVVVCCCQIHLVDSDICDTTKSFSDSRVSGSIIEDSHDLCVL